jgi:hypothetical protein
MTKRYFHQSAKQPSLPQSCEPRHGFIGLIFFQETEPSSKPTLPPTAPMSFDDAPVADGLLKS